MIVLICTMLLLPPPPPAGFDYAPLTTLLMFTPTGPRRQCTTVTILEDTVQEDTETFSISLTSGDFPGSLGSPAIVSILDTLGM